MNRMNVRGETIVEVIISIAVVASVLSGAYYLIGRSTRQSQAAVERVAATKAAESKVELLRSLPKENIANSIGGDKKCVSANGVVDYDATKVECMVDRYEVTVTKNGLNYQVSAVWDGLIADKENVTIYYRP